MEQLTLSAKALESQKTEINSIAAISNMHGDIRNGRRLWLSFGFIFGRQSL